MPKEVLRVPQLCTCSRRGGTWSIFFSTFLAPPCCSTKFLKKDLRPERPFTGVSGPSGPEIPKKSQKSLPGPPGPECPKSLEKSRKVSKKSRKSLFCDTFLRHFDSFRDFLDTPGREARGDFFETFWGFRARRARRLL